MSKSKLTLSLLTLAFGLSACTGNLSGLLPDPVTVVTASPTSSKQVTPNKTSLFANAQSKRPLPLEKLSGSGTQSPTQTAPKMAGSTPVAAPAMAEGAPASADKAVAIGAPSPAIMPSPRYDMIYYPGGGDFNSYVVTYAEENIYSGSQDKTLLTVYQKTIQPILKEWDSQARLLESRGRQGALNTPYDDGVEYVYIPGNEGQEPVKLKPNWVFRFASTPQKETLTIYVTPTETHVLRFVWGEPHVEMDKVKVDSDKAISIAREAFANRSTDVKYAIYPQPEQLGPEGQIIYDLPEPLTWQLSLNQQGKNIRYFLSFSYFSGKMLEPQPMPAVLVAEQVVSVTVPTALFQILAEGSGSTSGSTGIAVPAPYTSLYGSITIDATTGDIIDLNRPVVYQYDRIFPPQPAPMPEPVEPKPESTVAPVEPETKPTSAPVEPKSAPSTSTTALGVE